MKELATIGILKCPFYESQVQPEVGSDHVTPKDGALNTMILCGGVLKTILTENVLSRVLIPL
jgi:hypothetical protein